jgi:hypothetical protein
MIKSSYLLMILVLVMVVGCNSPPHVPYSQNCNKEKSHKLSALVIGNSNYDNGTLDSTINNAVKMTNVLESFCFKVTLEKDLEKKEMYNVIHGFTECLHEGSVGLFYFAGHGAFGGEGADSSFLLPINNEGIHKQTDLSYDAYPVGQILTKMKKEKVISIIILDACYANPYSGTDTQSLCINQSIKNILETTTEVTGNLINGGFLITGNLHQNNLYAKKLIETLTTVQEEIPMNTVFYKLLEENVGFFNNVNVSESVVFKKCVESKPLEPLERCDGRCPDGLDIDGLD